MRIAYFSPLPPQRSGIADYSRELIPHLAQSVELCLYVPDASKSAHDIVDKIEVRSISEFTGQQDEFDLMLYHIGNSEFHDEIARIAQEVPGIVVLHDFFLHHAVAQRTIGQGDRFSYYREMGYAQGANGIHRAMDAIRGIAPPVFEVPLNGRLLDVSLGVIVHSQYTARLVRGQGFGGPLAIIPAQIAPHSGRSRREELNLPRDAILFGSFGLLSREKQIVETLQALRSLRDNVPDAHYLLVGESLSDLPIKTIIRELDLQDAVYYAGYAAQLKDFIDWIHTADVVINLRNPTVGETSATALRAMAAGKPLIVSDHGWYREIPDNAAFKVSPETGGALLDAMQLISRSQSLRESMGAAGLRFTREVCSPESVAAAYVRAFQDFQKSVRIYG